MFVDSHCHLSYKPLVDDLDAIVANCEKEKISNLLTISTNVKTSHKSIEISKKYKNIFCTIGIHPCEISKEFNLFSEIENILSKKNKNIIGIGETGLDFYKNDFDKNKQIDLFEKHINLSSKNNLPIIVHSRNAELETICAIKKERKKNDTNFLLHCFTGSEFFLKELLSLGVYISFSGIITFKNSHNLREMVKIVPDDKLLIETDSPFLSPDPLRGKINFPTNIKYVAEKIAEVKNKTLKNVADITSKNFKNLFNL